MRRLMTWDLTLLKSRKPKQIKASPQVNHWVGEQIFRMRGLHELRNWHYSKGIMRWRWTMLDAPHKLPQMIRSYGSCWDMRHG